FLYGTHGVNGRISVLRANVLNLQIDGSSRVGILFGAMAGDKEGSLSRAGRARKGESLNHLFRSMKDHGHHVRMTAYGAAVKAGLAGTAEPALKFSLLGRAKAQVSRAASLAEIALADDQRRQQHSI